MPIKNEKLLLPLALTCLGFSVLLREMSHGNAAGNFFAGVAMGLSLTISIFCLMRGVFARSYE